MRDDLGAAVVYVGGRLLCHAGVGRLLPCSLACQLQVDAAHAAGHPCTNFCGCKQLDLAASAQKETGACTRKVVS